MATTLVEILEYISSCSHDSLLQIRKELSRAEARFIQKKVKSVPGRKDYDPEDYSRLCDFIINGKTKEK
jgi:hypothetical protein